MRIQGERTKNRKIIREITRAILLIKQGRERIIITKANKKPEKTNLNKDTPE